MMDISAIASAANAFSAAQVGDSSQLSVPKKAQNADKQEPAAVLQVQPQPSRLPSHLGQNVNTTA